MLKGEGYPRRLKRHRCARRRLPGSRKPYSSASRDGLPQRGTSVQGRKDNVKSFRIEREGGRSERPRHLAERRRMVRVQAPRPCGPFGRKIEAQQFAQEVR